MNSLRSIKIAPIASPHNREGKTLKNVPHLKLTSLPILFPSHSPSLFPTQKPVTRYINGFSMKWAHSHLWVMQTITRFSVSSSLSLSLPLSMPARSQRQHNVFVYRFFCAEMRAESSRIIVTVCVCNWIDNTALIHHANVKYLYCMQCTQCLDTHPGGRTEWRRRLNG